MTSTYPPSFTIIKQFTEAEACFLIHILRPVAFTSLTRLIVPLALFHESFFLGRGELVRL